MEEGTEFLKGILSKEIIYSIIIVIISFITYELIKRLIKRSETKGILNKYMNNKSKTYFKMIISILRYIFIIVTLLIVLQINGINVSSMLAGVGIVSVIIGLAVQDALKDIIRGFSILSDGYFSVGDVVSYNDIMGKVLVIGFKTTKIKDLATDNIVSIANRNIEQIQVVSKTLYVKYPMPYEVPIDRGEEVAGEIVEAIKKCNDVEDAEYKGVTELDDSCIRYFLKVTCNPERRLQVRRDTLGCILRVLDKNNIEVPYNQIDVHQK